MPTICTECNAQLPIGGDSKWGLLFTEFPNNLYGCLILLLHGPGAVPCLRCNHISKLATPHIMVGENGSAVLYLSEHYESDSGHTESEVMAMVAKARKTDDRGELLVTHGLREFRREVLLRVMEPHLMLMNRFVFEAGTQWGKSSIADTKAPMQLLAL